MSRAAANAIVATLAAAVPASFAVFIAFRRMAMASPDPFDPARVDLAGILFVLFIIATVAAVAATAALGRKASRRVVQAAWIVIAPAGLFVSFFLYSMLKFFGRI